MLLNINVNNSYFRRVHILRDLGLLFPLLAAMDTSPLAGILLKAAQLGPMRTLISCIVILQTTARPRGASCHLLCQLKQYREVRYYISFVCIMK